MFIFFILFIMLGIGLCGFIYYNSKDEINELLGLSTNKEVKEYSVRGNEDKEIIKGQFDRGKIIEEPDKSESTKISIREVLCDLVEKVSFWKKKQLSDELDTVPMPSLQDVLAGNLNDEETKEKETQIKETDEESIGTASLKIESPEGGITSMGDKEGDIDKNINDIDTGNIPLNGTSQLQQSIEKEVGYNNDIEKTDISSSSTFFSNDEKFKDLEEKYKKLDTLFAEKTEELRLTKRQLENEIKNRQEFEKIKELMEKEIEALKEKVKSLREELDKVNADKDEHKQKSQIVEKQSEEQQSSEEI